MASRKPNLTRNRVKQINTLCHFVWRELPAADVRYERLQVYQIREAVKYLEQLVSHQRVVYDRYRARKFYHTKKKKEAQLGQLLPTDPGPDQRL